ncbi:MAG: PD-(D/E)XK nuclease family protein [Halioglobus sp.]
MSDKPALSPYDVAALAPLVESGFVLLTPNFRLARRIKAVWDDAQVLEGRRVWSPIQVAPLESWLKEQWAQAIELGLLDSRVTIDEGQAGELWQQVIAEHQKISERYTLLRPSAAATLASQARETLLRWQVDVTSASVKQEFELDDDCHTYLCWHQLFEEKLEKKKLLTYSDAFHQLLSVAGELPHLPVALVDFDDIPPLYRSCVDACSSQSLLLDSRSQRGDRVARGFADKRSELAAAARWARQQYLGDPSARIGIILPNTTTDRATLELLMRRDFDCQVEAQDSLPVNFSSGIALDRVAVVRDALRALALTRPSVNVPDIVQLMQSRFIVLPDGDSALANKLITTLFNEGRRELSSGELRHLASQVRLDDARGLSLGDKLLDISQMRDLKSRHLPSRWVNSLSDVLSVWGWPGRGPLNSIEYQQVEMWYQLLDDFASQDVIAGAVSLSDALQLLGRAASRQVFQPKTPDSPIQVLGMLEGAGLEFDQLWLCGMQANTWPAPARPSPLIPLSLQREKQMPHATPEREWAFAINLMERYERSSPQVNASFVRLIDGVPELPSAFLEGFDWQTDGLVDYSIDPLWYQQNAIGELECVDSSQAPPVESDEASSLSGGSGLLEDQSNCAFRAFAKRRLRVQPLGEFQLGLSAADRGSLLHDALYALWGELGDSRTLQTMAPEGIDKSVKEAAHIALQSIPSRRRIAYGEAYLQLEGHRLQSLLLEWLQIEAQRSEFAVQSREVDLTLPVPPLEIKLRVDRVDELPDGSQLIIDYKSGRCELKDWLGERPAKPQLLAYGMASSGDKAASDVSALAFAQLRPRECTYVGAGRLDAAAGIRTDIVKMVGEKHAVDHWQGLNEAWRTILERLVSEFVAGDAAVAPLSSSSCTYCGLQPLCRVDEVRSSGK